MYLLFEPTTLITVLLVVLCAMASMDLWRQYALRNESYLFDQYTQAVSTDSKYWKFGFKLEDLEFKLNYERVTLNKILDTLSHPSYQLRWNKGNVEGKEETLKDIRKYRNNVGILQINSSAVYQIRCESKGNYLRIGLNDFRSDDRDVCQIFTSTESNDLIRQPHSYFEMVPLSEGAFGFRSIANNYFLKAVGPPEGNENAPWKVIVAGSNPGYPERFRLTDKGYLYSSIMGGFMTCGSGDIVKGYSSRKAGNRFILESVPIADVQEAQNLVSLSDQILSIQKKGVLAKSKQLGDFTTAEAGEVSSHGPVRIAVCIPITSKGTKMSAVLDSPFWTNIFDSFMKSIDWRSNKYYFKFFLGFDKADELYDTGDAWSDMRDEFHRRAMFRLTEQMIEVDEAELIVKKHIALKMMHFDHLDGAPSQVVSQLVLTGYLENYDYFYQVNDDTVIVSPNWPSKLVSCLSSNPFIANFGVTGPTDSNNDKIFTHSFVHRTHIEIFGYLFPPSFKNWWSDDWITTVYGSDHTITCTDVEIKHNIGAQKLHSTARYTVDKSAQLRLIDELRLGYVKIDEWLKKNSFPTLTLPNICGYSPLVKRIKEKVKLEEKSHSK